MFSMSNHQRHANEIHNELSPHTFNIVIITKQNRESRVGKGAVKRESLYAVSGNVNYSGNGKTYGGPSKQFKKELPHLPEVISLAM